MCLAAALRCDFPVSGRGGCNWFVVVDVVCDALSLFVWVAVLMSNGDAAALMPDDDLLPSDDDDDALSLPEELACGCDVWRRLACVASCCKYG